MHRWTAAVCAVLVTAVWAAGPAEAQVERGNFDVNVGGGVILHQNASALVTASPVLNLRGRAFLNDNIGLGFSLDYSRTETDDDVFPLAQFQFPANDSTIFVALRQPVALFHYQLIATFGAPVSGGSLYPYLLGGIGGYTIYLDPQQNDGPERQSDLALSVGGAVKLNLSGTSAIELGIRDVIYTGFERDRLNPTPDRDCRLSTERQFEGRICPNERFPFLNPDAPDAKETVHNLVLTASFSFFPRF